MADEDDKSSMARLHDGDDLALNELMTRWKEPVITFCLRYTGNLTDAKEIAQETFVKVYQARYRYRPQEGVAFSTWLFRIATNLCRMRHRWKMRHPELLDVVREESAVGSTSKSNRNEDPGHTLDLKILAEDLDAAIRTLPPDLRTAFILQELHGESQANIASIQCCSAKAVEHRLARARKQLREILRDRWR